MSDYERLFLAWARAEWTCEHAWLALYAHLRAEPVLAAGLDGNASWQDVVSAFPSIAAEHKAYRELKHVASEARIALLDYEEAHPDLAATSPIPAPSDSGVAA